MADEKVSQASVEYQAYPYHNARCDHCVHFIPPDKCEHVEGPINKHGWCKRFEKGKARGRLYGRKAA